MAETLRGNGCALEAQPPLLQDGRDALNCRLPGPNAATAVSFGTSFWSIFTFSSLVLLSNGSSARLEYPAMKSDFGLFQTEMSGLQDNHWTNRQCGRYQQAALAGRQWAPATSLAPELQADTGRSGKFQNAIRAMPRKGVRANLSSRRSDGGLDSDAGDLLTPCSPWVHWADTDSRAERISSYNGLTNSDAGILASVFEHEIARNTLSTTRPSEASSRHGHSAKALVRCLRTRPSSPHTSQNAWKITGTGPLHCGPRPQQ